MAKTKLRRGFGIPRVSKRNGREGESFRSPDNQWDDIRAVAKRNGIEIVDGGADIDVSGTTMQRRYLREGIEAIRNRKADALVFAKLDRYARNTLGGLETLDEVEALGGSLYFGDIDVDTKTPRGRQIFTILLSNAEAEVAEKAIELARNARKATEAGIAISPLLPGYKRDARRRVIRDKTYSKKLLRTLFEMRRGGASFASLRRFWHEQTGEWVKQDKFRRMIESRVYVGELVYGGDDVDGKFVPYVSPVRHEAVVSEELWKDAQTAKVVRAPRSPNAPSLLAGILVCGTCGHPMTAGKGAKGHRVYRCQSRQNVTWTCSQPVSVMGDKADAYVTAELLGWAERDEYEALTTGERTDDFAEADERIEQAQSALKRAIRVLASADVDEDEAAEELAGLREERDEAVAARRRLDDEQVAEGTRIRVRDLWNTLAEEGDVEAQRRLVRAAVARVVVQPATLTDAGGYARTPLADRARIVFVGDEDDAASSEAVAD